MRKEPTALSSKLNKPLGIGASTNSCHGTQVIWIFLFFVPLPLINFTAAVFESRNRLCSVPAQSAENESRLLNLWSPLTLNTALTKLKQAGKRRVNNYPSNIPSWSGRAHTIAQFPSAPSFPPARRLRSFPPDVIFRKQLNGEGGDASPAALPQPSRCCSKTLKQEVSWEVGKGGRTGWLARQFCFSCTLWHNNKTFGETDCSGTAESHHLRACTSGSGGCSNKTTCQTCWLFVRFSFFLFFFKVS